MWKYNSLSHNSVTGIWAYNELCHHGIKGQRWGVRRTKEQLGSQSKPERLAYAIGAKLNPRELKYQIRKAFNNPNDMAQLLAGSAALSTRDTGVLPYKPPAALKAIETMGIKTHSKTVYDNLDSTDIARLKTYTNSARYSRSVNGYLAIGEPKDYAQEANNLKATLQKNKVDNVTVYRSCNLKFSIDGVANKLKTASEEELAAHFGEIAKNFAGKSRSENRVFSTSTSPLFAIDTWRAVNPTAASTYNTYMVINCKNCSGVLADGRTKTGKSLVNTRSNQEAILAPSKLTYRNLQFDKKRGMFALTFDASSDGEG